MINFRNHSKWSLVPALLLLIALAVFSNYSAVALDMGHLLSSFQRYHPVNSNYFIDWQNLLQNSQSAAPSEKLKRVNEFFNRRILFESDQTIWNKSDYWATPLETLAKGKGDCEDFTIAKYFTLLNMNIPNEQLRLIYVKARIGGPSSSIEQAHMVLAYYPAPDAEPLVLDNLITDIRPASRRPDLVPVFSFNSQGIYAGGTPQSQPAVGNVSQLSRWSELLQRVSMEGFN